MELLQVALLHPGAGRHEVIQRTPACATPAQPAARDVAAHNVDHLLLTCSVFCVMCMHVHSTWNLLVNPHVGCNAQGVCGEVWPAAAEAG